MTLQVLVSTMHQTDHSLLDRMRIDSDAIVINQCDTDQTERFEYKGHRILWISARERGVGLSRNTALMRATADIVLFADDDVVYEDGYARKVLQAYEARPEADLLLVGLEVIFPDRTIRSEEKEHRVRFYNGLHYGAVHFSARRQTLVRRNLCFHLNFGGGARYAFGEDSIFLTDALKRGLKCFAVPVRIGTVYQNNSTWFRGYNEKYFHDRGVLMETIFGIWAWPLTLVLLLKNRRETREFGLKKAIRCTMQGIRDKQR